MRCQRFRELLDALPAAVYTTDAAGRITYYNDAAASLWGHRPTLGSSEWCGSWKLFWPDGTPLPHDECPMAVALKEDRAVRGTEAAAERPDGTRVPFIPLPDPDS
jgi:PAS domain S-box-containing protein